ncbi:MAG: L-2-hydroxyglutarate oxidase [Halobacteriales archaeon]|nr:L-2-hydroxyglutarate oxidase [Halobacteriales archaeon]
MTDHEVVVVGGGCVGVSTARHLAERDIDVAVVEKEYALAEHQSGRNSGVLHPGFNYEPGTLKARFAVEGTRRMKEYCAERGVPVDECGVLVVALDEEEEERLDTLKEQADENGTEARIVGSDFIEEKEPHVSDEAQAALYAPEAASVDSRKYVHALAGDAERDGATLYLGHEVRDASYDGEWRVKTNKGELSAEYIVNAAGLYADRMARLLDEPTEHRVVPFRGEYYELKPDASDLCRTMIYPTPDPELPFLGVHYTRRTDGKVIVGPNAVLAFGREAYTNRQFSLRELAGTLSYGGFWSLMASRKMMGVAWDELNKSYRKSRFVRASQRLVPEASRENFVRSYAGVRAQLVSPEGELIKQPLVEHGEASTHVLNAVSPGLTCSLPFGEHLAEEAVERM